MVSTGFYLCLALFVVILIVVARSDFAILLCWRLERGFSKHHRLLSQHEHITKIGAGGLTMARFAFLNSPSDMGPLDVCLGIGSDMKGNPPDEPPGVLGDDIIPPGVLGPPSLANDPHPGVRGVDGDEVLKPDHPDKVGRFLMGCGIGGDVIRFVRWRVGLGGRVTPVMAVAASGVDGVVNEGEVGVGEKGAARATGVASDVVDVVVDCSCSVVSAGCMGLAASVSRLSDGLPVVGIVSRESIDVGGVGSPLSGLILSVATFGRIGSIGTQSSSVVGRSR